MLKSPAPLAVDAGFANRRGTAGTRVYETLIMLKVIFADEARPSFLAGSFGTPARGEGTQAPG